MTLSFRPSSMKSKSFSNSNSLFQTALLCPSSKIPQMIHPFRVTKRGFNTNLRWVSHCSWVVPRNYVNCLCMSVWSSEALAQTLLLGFCIVPSTVATTTSLFVVFWPSIALFFAWLTLESLYLGFYTKFCPKLHNLLL